MSDDEADLLRPVRSALAVLHGETRQISVQHQRQLPWERARIFGQRGIYRPTMAIHTISRLGPVRHALAQRSIAGTLEVHAPFAPELTEEAKELVDKLDRFRAGNAQKGRS